MPRRGESQRDEVKAPWVKGWDGRVAKLKCIQASVHWDVHGLMTAGRQSVHSSEGKRAVPLSPIRNPAGREGQGPQRALRHPSSGPKSWGVEGR